MCIKALCNQVFVCYSSPSVIIILRPVKQPVSKMKSRLPQIPDTAFPDIFDPCFHAAVLVGKQFSVSIGQVHIPGNDRGGIRPSCRSYRHPEYVRNNKWYNALLLVCSKILQPLGKEVIYIHVEGGRAGKHLCITRPSETLITLGAISGYI